jgi:hypothetical protein
MSTTFADVSPEEYASWREGGSEEDQSDLEDLASFVKELLLNAIPGA